MKETILNRYVYDFSVVYSTVDKKEQCEIVLKFIKQVYITF